MKWSILTALAALMTSFNYVILTDAAGDATEKTSKQLRAAAKLPPCGACTALVSSFEAGMAETARGKLGGGDTAWEEKNQARGYSTSEVRLVEIQEKLCQDLHRGENQCHDNHHHWEEHIESWWKLDAETRTDLRNYLCVESLKVCCPQGHFGQNCMPCLHRDPQTGVTCSGNGKCKGDGTRKGNGACSCDAGYSGETCNNCAEGYFQSYRDDLKVLCTICHKACSGSCTGSGPASCLACQSGYLMDAERGCLDVDECATTEHRTLCGENEFCVNTEGSHRCVECDKACNGCHGDGPDSCLACADGYVVSPERSEDVDGDGHMVCISEDTAGRMASLSNSRYFTYFGLCAAAAIISYRSYYIAGILGLVIAAYISLAEYYLRGATGELTPMGW